MRAQTEQMLQEWLVQAETEMRAFLAWTEAHPLATLREREEQALAMRQALLGGALQANLSISGTGNQSEPPRCRCGTQREDHGVRQRTIETTVGSVTAKRTYYICPECGGGVFPPRRRAGSGKRRAQ
jgi:hypothetical protein